jgi:hypothetical protein
MDGKSPVSSLFQQSFLLNFFSALSSLPYVFQSSVALLEDIITERLFRVSTSNVILFFLKIGSHQVTGMAMTHFETVNNVFTGM